MNILDVIKDCILSPHFLKNYDLEELTVSRYSDSQSVTNESSFSNYTTFKQANNLETKGSAMDQRIVRMYMRVWSALCKCILKTIADGSCFVSLSLGYLRPSKDKSGRVIYSPFAEILEKHGCELAEDECNVNAGSGLVSCEASVGGSAEGVCEVGGTCRTVLLG
eukprot:TRINITY_DN15078_c0_g1_i2.p3 TRINITY_DN15078_c0_g1~~TRINITY_DN15078_c0_g1_i2.p3  ORF type:complete len:165 (+),score=50.22 TRINITY_DN15078_c0_g1_i2:75-569(+)